MPNWSYTVVCFKGKPDNMIKLINDISSTIDWTIDNDYKYLNISHLLQLQGFYTDKYLNSPNVKCGINFRGSVIEHYPFRIEHFGSFMKCYIEFEMAWSMDYNLLHLISKIYEVEFSAYCEEPSMGVYTKCRNGNENCYDYDISISPDWEQITDDELDDFPMAVKRNSNDHINTIHILEANNIDYEVNEIYEDNDAPTIYGLYYDTDDNYNPPTIYGKHINTDTTCKDKDN